MNGPKQFPSPSPFELPPADGQYETDDYEDDEQGDDWVNPGGTSDDWE